MKITVANKHHNQSSQRITRNAFLTHYSLPFGRWTLDSNVLHHEKIIFKRGMQKHSFMAKLMKTEFHPKFLFSQISGVIVGCTSLYPALKAMIFLWPNFVTESHSHFINASIIGFLLLASVILSITIWGKLLVLFGVLTNEEAKGYPYSKPWESDDNFR